MKRILIGMMLALLFVLTACGNGTTTNDTINIGFIGPLTGDAAYLGSPVEKTLQFAVDELNENGGVNGKQLVFFAEDGKCDGKEAVNAFLKLQNANDIDAVVMGCSPELLAIAPVAEQYNVLVISPMATAPSISDAGDHVFRLIPSDALQGKVGADILKERGYNRIGVIYVNHDYGVGLNNVLKKELGSKIVLSEAFDPKATDFRSILTKMDDVDALYLVAFPKEGELILKQMKELGMDLPIVAAESIKTDTILPLAKDIVITVPQAEGDGFSLFAAKFETRFDEKPGLYTGEAYDVIQVIAKAAENSDDLVEGMQSVRTHDGVAGFVTFDAKGDVKKPYDLFTVENEAFVKAE